MRVMDGLFAFPILILAYRPHGGDGVWRPQRHHCCRGGFPLPRSPASRVATSWPFEGRTLRRGRTSGGHRLMRPSSSGMCCRTFWHRSSCRGRYVSPAAMITEAGLEFPGAGTAASHAGMGLDDRRGALISSIMAPHIPTFPGIALMMTVVGLNLLGDGLRDTLDPRLRRWGRVTEERPAGPGPEPVLDVRDLVVEFAHRGRPPARGRSRQLLGRPRRDRRARRRVGLREERPAAGGCSAGSCRRRGRVTAGSDRVRRARTCSRCPRSSWQAIRGGAIRVDPAGSDPIASFNPVAQLSATRSPVRSKLPPRRAAGGGVWGARGGGGSCHSCRHQIDGARKARPLSVQLQPGAAPAGDDAMALDVRALAAPRRRADHRPRRHDPGPDPRAPRRTRGAARHRHGVGHAQHGRRRLHVATCCHVRRQGGGGGPDAGSCSLPPGTRTPSGCSKVPPGSKRGAGRQATPIEGSPPVAALPEGCAFAPRCRFAIRRQPRAEPPLEEIEPGHRVACWVKPGG